MRDTACSATCYVTDTEKVLFFIITIFLSFRLFWSLRSVKVPSCPRS